MKRGLALINDSESVSIPSDVKMNISEIASLFGIFHQTAKRHIRAIAKLGIADGDYSLSCVAEGLKIYPEYYGLDMVIAISFRVQTSQAVMFRRWVVKRTTNKTKDRIIVLPRVGSQGMS